jgi:hypothetical protein
MLNGDRTYDPEKWCFNSLAYLLFPTSHSHACDFCCMQMKAINIASTSNFNMSEVPSGTQK